MFGASQDSFLCCVDRGCVLSGAGSLSMWLKLIFRAATGVVTAPLGFIMLAVDFICLICALLMEPCFAKDVMSSVSRRVLVRGQLSSDDGTLLCSSSHSSCRSSGLSASWLKLLGDSTAARGSGLIGLLCGNEAKWSRPHYSGLGRMLFEFLFKCEP